MSDKLPDNPRKSPRAAWIDYDYGTYFVTICTHNRCHYFGEIIQGQMHLSEIGNFVKRELENPAAHNLKIDIPLFVVMPNHIHAIIHCDECQGFKINALPGNQRNPNPSQRTFPDMKRQTPLLSKYIGLMKAAVSRYARTINPEFRWQARYYDHAIRGTHDGNKIADYIETNVIRWESDCFFD